MCKYGINRSARSFYHDLIDLVNQYDVLPWEVRRVVIENVQLMTEKKADEAIRNEDIEIDTIEIGEEGEQCKNPTLE
jgi:hypothetical protein